MYRKSISPLQREGGRKELWRYSENKIQSLAESRVKTDGFWGLATSDKETLNKWDFGIRVLKQFGVL